MTFLSLSHRIRRLILCRLGEGDCTFMQAGEAAVVDDTSKLAFHLRTLTEHGMVGHTPRGLYHLTPKGRGAVTILRSIDRLELTNGRRTRISPSLSRRMVRSSVKSRPAKRKARAPKVLPHRRVLYRP